MTGEDPSARWRALVAEHYGLTPHHEQPRTTTATKTTARRFVLVRHVDVSGVSGTGIVAEGIEWTDKTVSLHWLGDRPSTTVWNSIEDVEAIHGHSGLTVLQFIDGGEA